MSTKHVVNKTLQNVDLIINITTPEPTEERPACRYTKYGNILFLYSCTAPRSVLSLPRIHWGEQNTFYTSFQD